VVQSTSDEGKGILHHVKADLGAHHAPDVFHVQHEIVKGTSAVLASKKRKAEKLLEQASEDVQSNIREKEKYLQTPHGPGRPPQFDKRIEESVRIREEAIKNLESTESHQQQMKEAIQKISTVYHPVNLETGELRQADAVSESLNDCFQTMETVASDAKLLDRSLKKIQKAKKVIVDMVATILFYHMSVQAKVEALCMPLKVEQAIMNTLIPGLYIERVSRQAKRADDRRRLREKSIDILKPLHGGDSPFSGLGADELELIEKVAKECANLFQRSSSCVEGRNGQLSLRHHGLHRISSRKLTALTAVHNYFIKRRDGTTPAERFFGVKPKEMFEFLLNNIDMPGRPARSRS
jgi:vacuolar-type H+-ATPase subunit I/STV1